MDYNGTLTKIDMFINTSGHKFRDYYPRYIIKDVYRVLSDVDIRLISLRVYYFKNKGVDWHNVLDYVLSNEDFTSISEMYKTLSNKNKFSLTMILVRNFGLFPNKGDISKLFLDKDKYKLTEHSYDLFFIGEGSRQVSLSYGWDGDVNLSHIGDIGTTRVVIDISKEIDMPADLDIVTIEEWVDYFYVELINKGVSFYKKMENEL